MQIQFTFQVDPQLMPGIVRMEKMLKFSQGDGIRVIGKESSQTGVALCDGTAVITYSRKHLFFRQLGILVENAHKGAFIHNEDTWFECISAMIDASRCSVPTVDAVKKLLDYMAVMGYSMAMMYTEDTVELENRPYFGYMRGRYTVQELRAIDDYANDYGIEVIPCLECYGHMHRYLMWGEADKIRDTAGVLMAREEETFRFLDELIGTVSSCFRSRRIHIGMDEAWDMGRGKFLDKHGYVPPFQIFNEYMTRLIAITDRYGLTPMMWSDMYFRVNTNNNSYYDPDTEVPQETIDQIPESVELVFWHYGEQPSCDDYMLEKHEKLGRKIIYAGGLWGWIGHFPEHNYAKEACKISLDACRNHNVHEAMITIWTNDNAECDLFANLYGLSFFAEMCYEQGVTKEKLDSRFRFCTGGDADAFYNMSLYHNTFGPEDDYSPNFHDRFLGKPLFWQDIMEGLYDTYLVKKPMSGHYAACAAKMKDYAGGNWDYLYDFAYKVFDYMAVKTRIAEILLPAYQAGEKDVLRQIADVMLPQLKEKTVAVHKAHKQMWFASNKVLGWSNLDIRYGGMACRCDTAAEQINLYLEGKLDTLEELDQTRLHKPLSGFAHYAGMCTVNGTI